MQTSRLIAVVTFFVLDNGSIRNFVLQKQSIAGAAAAANRSENADFD